jgi:hypothetical protein
MRLFAPFVNWDEAKCRGMDTELFYEVEEKRQAAKQEILKELRQVCASCPIWDKCLQWGFENEWFGVWGGLTSPERDSFLPTGDPGIRESALHALNQYGITEKAIRDLMP